MRTILLFLRSIAHFATAQALMLVLFSCYALVWLCCCFAANAQQERRRWEEPQNLALLNTAADEFAPCFSAAERVLYYTSTQHQGLAAFFTANVEFRREAQSTELRPRFYGGGRVSTSLNQERTNQSYISFAKDGTILLSSFRMAKTRPYLNIFHAADRSNTFPKPVPLDAVNTDDFNAHASLSPSGRAMVFASTRTGGRGGIDLWSANRDESGAWQPPVNLGDIINSPFDEITPFLASEDSLFFSSNGFGGKGGFEIFLSLRIDGRWQAPIPLTELNSEYDDSDFTLLPGNIGIFASNRAGGRGGLDLYISRFLPISQLVSAVEYRIATQTNFLTLEEFSMTDAFPLPPCIFFEPNAASLPPDIKQYSIEACAQFSPQNLRPHPMVMYNETLNILGKRLQDYPAATLTISTLDGGNTALSRQRVEAVRSYLQNVWNIDGRRLVEGVPSAALRQRVVGYAGEDAVRCVEFSSNLSNILAPVAIAGVNVVAKPRKLDIALDARPRPAMRSWTFSLIGDGIDTLYRTSGTTLPFAMSLPLEASSWVNAPEEITARLVGTDSLGRTGKRELVIAVYRLPLDQKRAQKVQDKIIERYRILLPRENEATLNAEHLALIKDIAAGITGSVSITISPFSFDEKLPDNAAKALPLRSSERVARNIADELRRLAPGLIAQPPIIEANTELQAPETPQERMLTRMIVITLERPILPASSSSSPRTTPRNGGR